jgi:hypothetical protein
MSFFTFEVYEIKLNSNNLRIFTHFNRHRKEVSHSDQFVLIITDSNTYEINKALNRRNDDKQLLDNDKILKQLIIVVYLKEK